jgi:twitching motility protein PilT
MIQFFPSEIEDQIRTRISDSLIWVLSQRLVPRVDGAGRVAIREVMFANSAIRNLITKWDLVQIPNTIETSTEDGMITMRKYADTLRDQGIIEEKSYRGYFVNEQYS